jgi:hypothetical protein
MAAGERATAGPALSKAVSYLSAGAAERGSEAQKGRQTSRRWVSPSGTPETKHLVTGPFVPRHPGPCVRLELFGYPHTAEASGSLWPGLARGYRRPHLDPKRAKINRNQPSLTGT